MIGTVKGVPGPTRRDDPDAMRIAVFGAAGPIGRHLTDQALSAGHEGVREK